MRGHPALSTRGLAVYRGCMTGKDERAARLAEQLRANLRRRKAQARELKAAPEGEDQIAAHLPSSHARSSDPS